MDRYVANQYDNLQIMEAFPNVSSPEMFDSDVENEIANDNNFDTLSNDCALGTISPQKPSQIELIAKSDSYLLARINKFLSGVPPPPRHTICQSDCSDFLRHIYENRQFFWIECPLPKGNVEGINIQKQITTEVNRNISHQCTKGTPRNLTNAFDACDFPSNDTESAQLDINNSDSRNNVNMQCSSSEKDQINIFNETARLPSIVDNSNVSLEQSSLYHTIEESGAIALIWPQAYLHKFYGIHYNRSKTIEEFENLTIKLCERYIGAETQSTCNIWFSKQPQGSAKKRSLLAKRENGQSPEKRLTHLARRRRTFCSANLQRLNLTDKRQLMVQIKKPMHKKGKSPRSKTLRNKSPRGKSSRGKSPRSSTKKKVVRKLMLDGQSPCKSKLETSKRALFQSPPLDHAGPSKLLGTSNTDTRKIKRVLFSTPSKNESENTKHTLSREENRKRKYEEELSGPRLKWAKSLSFDCTYELKSTSRVIWDRHSSSSILSKNSTSFNQESNDLNETNRKKLLWAIAEALRSKGIGMTHPKFKQYASDLAHTIKKHMPDLENKDIPRKPGGTSARMLKLAKRHVLFLNDTRPTD